MHQGSRQDVDADLGFSEGDRARVSRRQPAGFLAFLHRTALRLRPGAADILALALHELAINAVEHGALSRPRGRIRVAWRIEDGTGGSCLHFAWTEAGCALPEEAGPMREGFGFAFLKRTLADAFKAKTVIAFAPSRLSCTIALPLTGCVALP